MPDALLLEVLLDSWDRNNTITTNLLRAIPEGSMDITVTAGSPSIAQLFTHMHYVRAVFVAEDAPEIHVDVPTVEWTAEHDRDRLAGMLKVSAIAVRDAVRVRLDSGREMDRHYDHPIPVTICGAQSCAMQMSHSRSQSESSSTSCSDKPASAVVREG